MPNEPTWGPWFRGLKRSNYELIPSFPRRWRILRPVDDSRNMEDELRQEFVMRAPSFISTPPQDAWDWYFLMQHSGAPTRLLDWTEGSLIALYFAVRDAGDDDASDAAVWVLDPWWLNKLAVGVSEVITPSTATGIGKEDAMRYKAWLPERFEKVQLPEFPVAVYPSYTVPRIGTQRSCFTVHGSDPKAFEKLASKEDSGLLKIVIPSLHATEIRKQLVLSGIDELTIYPDVDGLGRSLTKVLEIEAKAASTIWHV
jgi:FRG domain